MVGEEAMKSYGTLVYLVGDPAWWLVAAAGGGCWWWLLAVVAGGGGVGLLLGREKGGGVHAPSPPPVNVKVATGSAATTKLRNKRAVKKNAATPQLNPIPNTLTRRDNQPRQPS